MSVYLDIAKKVIEAKRFEPAQRNKDGMKWIGHRFPIKGGISLRDVWAREMCRPNPLFTLLRVCDKDGTPYVDVVGD